jgi:DNA polymerase-3 subunit epsilon
MRLIVLDTETTGLSTKDGHRVIEVGCIELIDRKFSKKSFHSYINPNREIDDGAQKIHGITNEFLISKPSFSEIANELIDFIKESELIIHNAAFDVGFLNYEFSLLGKKLGNITDYCTVFDSLKLARQLHPGQKNNLDALTKRYNIKKFNREYHGALLDAEILAHVYLAMTSGQQSLFPPDNMQSTTGFYFQNQKTLDKTKILADTKKTRGKKTLVIGPSETENVEHKEYIEFLNKKSGNKCLWNDDEKLL